MNLKIIFSHKFLLISGGIFIYFSIVVTVNYFVDPSDRMGERGIYMWLLSFPGIIFIFYPSMSLFLSEGENRRIEMIFSTAGSMHKIWLAKIVSLYLSGAFILFLLALLSYIFVADFNLPGYFANSLFPLIFFSSLTMAFSVIFRSINAAGLTAVGTLFFHLILYDLLRKTRFNIFLNPYLKPDEIDHYIWNKMVLQNRIGMVVISALLITFSIKMLEKREKFL